MDDYLAAFSSIVSDRVRYYELVKITIHTSSRKSYILIADRSIFFVTFDLGGVIKNSKIEYDNIKDIVLGEFGNKITLKLNKSPTPLKNDNDLGVYEILIETPDYTTLYDKIKIAIDTDYMIKHFNEPKNKSKVSIKSKETILPFYRYKKVTFGGYYFFLKKSFKDTSFNTMYSRRYEDDRGVSLTVNIKDPFPIYYMEHDDPFDLYNYTRRVIEEVKIVQQPIPTSDSNEASTNGIDDRKFYEILRDEIYYKKMNLNEDVAKWSFIPPLLDTCQDILHKYKLSDSMVNICNYWNEFCLIVNSFTSNTSHFTWNKELIELRVNNLRFKNEMYKNLKTHFNIVPSYFNLVKGFVVSILKLLPMQAIDQYIIYKLNDNIDVYTDEPLEYVYQIVHYLYGSDYSNQAIINKFKMRLADFIAFTMDELVIGNQLLLHIIVENLSIKIESALIFLMHFRSLNFNEKYTDGLFNDFARDAPRKRKDIDWNSITFNYYATSRLLEEGFINVLFHSEKIEYSNEKLIMLILSLFINFSYHNDKAKELMVNNNIAIVLNNFVLLEVLRDLIYFSQNECLLLTLKLILNLTKVKMHQIVFIQTGLLFNLIVALQCLTNSFRWEYIVDVMLYVYANYKGTVEQFNNILFCISKVINNRNMSLKVGRHLIRILLLNLSFVRDNNYIVNIFELLIKLANYVPNCLIMIENNVTKILEELDVKVDIIVQFSIKLSSKIRRKTIHCSI
ncbi:conserved hypothetical protein [Theileria orientalis strain Shintoku]|uniref:Uncharacterized protein n=1 Tax=Theileria orientalis strain Shintoku TaxID=869250 RepID=J4C8H6_THEOR|nr:conserved hypothetical protein [Theileria orientalis strain Shintoku]BAM40803.1 conserved hypothetical protein [Theileria orientalis strain Shintoku]|eukprot:XP_009691104.1 conserved hypothetical protein [Theileria orientalis strain Shintoku]